MSTETYEQMQARLDRAFKLVQPKSHWKDAVDATVHLDTLGTAQVSLEDIRAAVVHFTGTVPTLKLENGACRVTAIGYRAGPCGDH